MFNKGKWIWHKDGQSKDLYVNFYKCFNACGKTVLRIASDSNYTVYLNGKLAAFGQYADYPDKKIYDEIDVSEFVKDGENLLAVTVWYIGENFFTYKPGNAGLIYELECGGDIIAYSDADTLSRVSRDYESGVCHPISGQLGYSYHYDLRGYDGWDQPGTEKQGFTPSVVVDSISYNLNPRPIKKLILRDRIKSKMAMQGVFEYPENRVNTQTDMQHAMLGFRFPGEIGSGGAGFPFEFKANDGQNVFFIVDLGAETSGFLDFDITVPCDTDMEVGFGEHLVDGRCRTSIRDFTSDFKLKAGRNVFLAAFRRFGCRYLQFFIHTNNVKVDYAGLRPTEYPVNAKKPQLSNLLRNTIYEVCENTLLQCMHEHYEDCPWREQSLYTMDSRNQMLCGYYAFGEYEFPRACLDLISQGMRPDGILSLCYPAGADYPIPSFSLMYFVQMREYIDHSGDTTLAADLYPVLQKLMKTFTDKIGENGLCDNFRDGSAGRVWNFYEWSATMSGGDSSKVSYEAPLNADLSLALQNLAVICRYLGKDDDAERYGQIAKSVNYAIAKKFYNEQTRLFNSFDDRAENDYSVLTNSLCLLCGAADNVDRGRILEILEKNGGSYEGIRIIPNTLSMNSFRFDALLKVDFEKYRKVILDELDRDYLYMLRNGATSFWETIIGDFDFGYAGSLCHGWSALPIYYYEILNG
ncbi:MAG: hypothetical protein J5585_01855 [Clostridia bacterium]|nr:hypothetical protein [Clostridia bacterium]